MPWFLIYPWSKYSFLLFLGMVKYDNEFETKLKVKFSVLSKNTWILKLKRQLMFVLFAPINRPFRKQIEVYLSGFKRSWFVIWDWWISIHFVCFFLCQGSLLVIVIKTYSSEKCNREGGFWTSEFMCFWKAQ